MTAMIRGGVAILDEGNQDERKELGEPGSAAGQPALCGIDRGWDQDQGARELPASGDDERGFVYVRSYPSTFIRACSPKY